MDKIYIKAASGGNSFSRARCVNQQLIDVVDQYYAVLDVLSRQVTVDVVLQARRSQQQLISLQLHSAHVLQILVILRENLKYINGFGNL